MRSRVLAIFFAAILAVLSMMPAFAQQNIVTYKYDNSRDGQNTNEVVLTPANVNSNSFSKLFTYTTDGYAYAEPLFVQNVTIPGQGVHDVVFVATENDTVYAFDADSNLGTNGGLFWKTNLGIAATSVLFGVRYHHNVLNPLIGITGTPVIDPVSGTLYVDVFSGDVPNTTNCVHRIHALDIATGAERPFSPVLVQGTVHGTGVDATNGIVTFAPQNQMNRPALTLVNGNLYLAYGSYGDTDPYHGWVFGYNATNLQPLPNSVFASTPNATTNVFGVNAGEGAIWMGGDGICVDANTNLYFETGNGSFSAITNGGDYGDSFVKLSTTNNGFSVMDYFAPSNQGSMDVNDLDLGSGGPMLLPDAAGSPAHRHLIIGAGKEGTLYLVDRDNMGHWSSASNQIVQTLPSVIGGLWGTGAYWNNIIYYQGVGDVMKAFRINNAVMSTSPISKTTTSFSGVGYSPVISANGTNNGIAWVLDTDAYGNNGPVILYAYNATNLSQILYSSSQNLNRDNPGGAVKYTVPTVANGHVYVAGEFTLSVFGIGTFLPAPNISPTGGVFTNSVTVTITDATNGTTIYYTLDGTAPTTNSFLYNGQIVLTNSAGLNAIATKPGAFNSPIASASFINSSAIGNGTGLLASYWSNVTSTAFTNLSFNTPPTLTRTDAVVNFNWSTNGPDPRIGATNYVVRWTGTIEPQFNEPYTFYTTADDGVRLFINGQLLIDDWVTQGATARSNTIPLKAQQFYNIELDYFYKNDNGSQVSLAWSSPSSPPAIIPQTQLNTFTNPPPTIVLSTPNNGDTYPAAATLSLSATADTPYNSLTKVDFYANGTLLGTLNSSPFAPLYALTVPGFNPNPGGETSNSVQVSATPAPAVNLTTTNVEAAGTDWTAAIWKTNGAGTAVAPVAGSTYTTVFNGTTIGNSTVNTRIRNPALSGVQTFPGDVLTMNTNTELRVKNNGTTVNFPGVGGAPGLILNGGMMNCGDDAVVPITGSIQVASQSYISMGTNGGGGGIAANRGFNISATLSGSGNLVLIDGGTNLPQIVSGTANTFSGQWIIQCGWLQAAAPGSLGTNNIIVDPAYQGWLTTMPNATSPNGPAIFEVNYDLVSSGSLTIANGGTMKLHQNCAFSAVTIQGVSLSIGAHPYSELIANFPNTFFPGGSGAITVADPPPPGPPGPASAPGGLTATPGNGVVTLSWTPVPGATNYNVKRSTTSGGPYSIIASLNATSYSDNSVANGTTYYYVVSAIASPGYTLTAVATDGSGLSSTSAPVVISVSAGSGLPYGLASNSPVPPFLNMPNTFNGSLPQLLSQTGAFANTSTRAPNNGLIPYTPNTPLWSDGAVKSRYMSVPNNGGLITPDEQIAFAPTGSWTFPAGTVFVKNFDLVVNETNATVPLRRLETRLLVRDINGAVYGVTYKWRPDNSDADLLSNSQTEDIQITNATGVRTQTWYYPSPADCLICHTPVANYVLGLNTRQLNASQNYPATGNTDNQLRALNHLGLFYPAINEANISSYSQLSALTNLSASLEQRARSYLDANCAQCHQPGGTGITFDARYDTPLAQQYITNYPAAFSLGYDRACIIKAQDQWRSVLLIRVNTNDPAIKMPPLARNVIDTNAVQVITDWLNSLPGLPALAPPSITPPGGTFTTASVMVSLAQTNTNAVIYYTLDGTLPTTNSLSYTVPFNLTNSVTLRANAAAPGFDTSVASLAQFTLPTSPYFTASLFVTNGQFQLTLNGAQGSTYILQASTNLTDWLPIATNVPPTNIFNLIDTNAANFPQRFYRVIQQ